MFVEQLRGKPWEWRHNQSFQFANAATQQAVLKTLYWDVVSGPAALIPQVALRNLTSFPVPGVAVAEIRFIRVLLTLGMLQTSVQCLL